MALRAVARRVNDLTWPGSMANAAVQSVSARKYSFNLMYAIARLEKAT